MKRFILVGAFAASALFLVDLAGADDKPKVGEKKAVGALAPSPLDGAFERANSEKDINEGLLNNDLYKKAVREALKAKQAQEKNYRDIPNFVGSTPAQAARTKFLEVLKGGLKDEK